ncbi:PAS domain-containing sensor histidine kinase [Nocardioides pantholopis]|uniref:PAS domain-containing sensor histidine kinase n=1 Tax=Nocardioides pantholopis TaxID=2483798 RepID=UPI000F0731FC|nr:ATP-binding protein [Nocardioides pantholopis]
MIDVARRRSPRPARVRQALTRYRTWWWDLGGAAVFVVGGSLLAQWADLAARFDDWSARHEHYRADDLMIVLVLSVLGLGWFSWRRYWQARAEASNLELAERRVVVANERYRSLFDYHPSAVFSLGLDGRFLTLNAAAQELTGRTGDELRALSGFAALLVPESVEPVAEGFLRVLERSAEHVDATIQRSDGSRVELSITGMPMVVDDEVVGVYGIAEDVTARNLMQRELARTRRRAEEASEAKSLFLANMSHEIRTPLTTIMAITELMAEGDAEPGQRRFLDMMTRNGQRLLRLVDDILDFSRIEAGQIRMERTEVDLRALVRDCLDPFRGEADRKGIALRLAFAERLPAVVLGDGERIRQVLANLVGNALKFTDAGAVSVLVEVLEQDDAVTRVVFRVEDTGIGITEDQMANLFDSFSQADASITRKYGGTGLGLAISKQLAELMDGTVDVVSEPGEGSTFSVELPLALVDAPGSQLEREPAALHAG